MLVSLVACDLSDVVPSDNDGIPSQSETQNNETENKETDNSETEQPTVKKIKHSNLDLFIEEYNNVAKTLFLSRVKLIFKAMNIIAQSLDLMHTKMHLRILQISVV